MRIWLDPNKLNSFALAPLDVTQALQAQNVQISGGQLGGTPAVQNQQLTAAITEATLLRTQRNSKTSCSRCCPMARRSGCATSPASTSAPKASTSTPSTTASPPPASASSSRPARTRSRPPTPCARGSRSSSPISPHGLQIVYPNDTTPFIRISIQEVVKTLLEESRWSSW